MMNPLTELAIAFTRTRGWEARDRSDDELNDWRGYMSWAGSAGALRAVDVRRLSALQRTRPAAAVRALRRADAFRQSVYRLLVACAAAERLPVSDVRALNTQLERAARMRVLVDAGSKLEWRWREAARSRPDFVLMQVAASASALLSGDAASRVRLCASHDCGWLFVDDSRNGLRRWCSMEGCGNVEKARRYRSRRR